MNEIKLKVLKRFHYEVYLILRMQMHIILTFLQGKVDLDSDLENLSVNPVAGTFLLKLCDVADFFAYHSKSHLIKACLYKIELVLEPGTELLAELHDEEGYEEIFEDMMELGEREIFGLYHASELYIEQVAKEVEEEFKEEDDDNEN